MSIIVTYRLSRSSGETLQTEKANRLNKQCHPHNCCQVVFFLLITGCSFFCLVTNIDFGIGLGNGICGWDDETIAVGDY